MSSVTRIITVRDSTIAPPGDNRKTGLTLTWVFLRKLTDNTNATQPAITEVAQGQYKFSYDADANGEASGQIDAGGTLTNALDRYIDVLLSLDSGRVITALPAASPAAAGGLPTIGTGSGQVNPDGTGAVPAGAASLSGVATATALSTLQTTATGINNGMANLATSSALSTLQTTANAIDTGVGNIASGFTVVRANDYLANHLAPASALPANFSSLTLTASQTVMAAGNVVVGGYAADQDPFTLLMAGSIETGVTFLQAERLMAAVLCGISSAGGTSFNGIGTGAAVTRLTAAVDSQGNRTSVTRNA